MNILKKILSNIWFWISLAFAVVLLAFKREQALRMLAELKLFKAETDAKNAVLEEKKAQVKDDIKKEEQHQKSMQEKLEKEKQEPRTPKEIESWWNKKKS